jgi:hypothetical protein
VALLDAPVIGVFIEHQSEYVSYLSFSLYIPLSLSFLSFFVLSFSVALTLDLRNVTAEE